MSSELPHEETAGREFSGATSSRVHFESTQVSNDHDLGIVKRQVDENTQEIHVGFLKLNHHYTIQFDIKDNLGEEVTADPLQNIHCRITSCPPTEDGEGHHVCLNFHAYKDKLIKQSLTIKNLDSSRSLKLILMARVLGKHKGTPMLKEGIRCVGVDPDDDSEQSDWAGFN